MTFGTPTQAGLLDLRHKRSQLEACAKSLLLDARAAGRETLSAAESRMFSEMNEDLRSLDERIEHYAHELSRVGTLPAGLGDGGGDQQHDRHAPHVRRSGDDARARVGHVVDRLGERGDLALRLEDELLRQVAVRDGGDDLDDAAHLLGEVRRP